MMGRNRLMRLALTLLLVGVCVIGGCDAPVDVGEVPSPIDKTLPHRISIHPYTGGPRALDDEGTLGLEVQIAALDSFGDNTKAFGDFRLELFEFRRNVLDPKGARLAVWEVDLLDPAQNHRHWDKFRQMYEFRLQWDHPASMGRRLVLKATFASPFTERLFDQGEFIAGE